MTLTVIITMSIVIGYKAQNAQVTVVITDALRMESWATLYVGCPTLNPITWQLSH